MNSAGLFLERNIKVIDLGADFRITDSAIWSEWYNMEHTQESLLNEAVYGQPEIKRSAIKGKTNVYIIFFIIYPCRFRFISKFGNTTIIGKQ